MQFPLNKERMMNRTAVLYALISAALFGLSTPAAKVLVGSIHPVTLAGLLYCGAGVGVAALRRILPAAITGAPETALSRADLPWLAAAIGAGGILGPLLLMFGLTRTDAATASLLLTLAGAALLSWSGAPSFDSIASPLAIAGACVAWGLDNNLTRKVSLADPLQIAMLKGLIAGPFNLILGLAISREAPSLSGVLLTGVVGFVGYGVSLALFVVALRGLGTARTGAYFSTAPFIGSAVAVIVLGEPVTAQLLVAAALMAFGVWLHLTEHHEHEHVHETLVHAHPHVHDIHHQHAHGASDPPGEPHTHSHEHRPMRHAHPHVPDMHHTHRHS